MALFKVILNQNYFQYDGKYFKAIEDTAMALPISGFIVELYLQYFEELSIRHWLESREILDDFLIIHEQTKTNEWAISMYMNIVHKHLKFKVTEEESKNINYKDLSISRYNNSLSLRIYRKPTQTDTTILYVQPSYAA